MVIKVDNTYYSVNISKYKGSNIADKVVSEIFKRINVTNLSVTEKRHLRAKIYTQYLQQA